MIVLKLLELCIKKLDKFIIIFKKAITILCLKRSILICLAGKNIFINLMRFVDNVQIIL